MFIHNYTGLDVLVIISYWFVAGMFMGHMAHVTFSHFSVKNHRNHSDASHRKVNRHAYTNLEEFTHDVPTPAKQPKGLCASSMLNDVPTLQPETTVPLPEEVVAFSCERECAQSERLLDLILVEETLPETTPEVEDTEVTLIEVDNRANAQEAYMSLTVKQLHILAKNNNLLPPKKARKQELVNYLVDKLHS